MARPKRKQEKGRKALDEMLKTLGEIGGIYFKLERHKDGTWSADSENLAGIMTGGDDPSEIDETIKDAIFTYFKVPKKYSNINLLKGDFVNPPVQEWKFDINSAGGAKRRVFA